MESADKENLLNICALLYRMLPRGRRFVIAVEDPSGGIYTMGNCDEQSQRETLRSIVRSFDKHNATTVHKGPVPPEKS